MKESYKKIKMSDASKEALLKHMHTKKTYKKSYVGIIVPTFIACCLFFLVISLNGNGQVVNNSSAKGNQLIIHAKELIIYWSILVALLMAAYVQFLFLIYNPKRLVEYRLIRAGYENLKNRKLLKIIAAPFIVISIFTIILLICASPLVGQFFIVVQLAINYFLFQLYIVKGRERAKCPYCDTELTTKEVNLNKKCGICGNERERKVTNTITVFASTFGWIFIMFMPVLNFELAYIFVFASLYCYLTFKYITPYIYEFEKKGIIPPPLW